MNNKNVMINSKLYQNHFTNEKKKYLKLKNSLKISIKISKYVKNNVYSDI